jgi:hypothetical protein
LKRRSVKVDRVKFPAESPGGAAAIRKDRRCRPGY